MKGKIIRGSGFRGALNYAFDVGPHSKGNKNATMIGGNMAGENPRELAAEFAALRALRPDVERPVWHMPLRLPAGEHIPAEKWCKIVRDTMTQMSIHPDKHPFVILNHADEDGKHLHLIASRIGYDGSLYLGKNENFILTRVLQELEKKHGLQITKGPEFYKDADGKDRIKMPEIRKPTGKEINKMGRIKKIPPRAKIQNALVTALKGKPTEKEFEKRLAAVGVKATKFSGGYSFMLEGSKVPFGGAKLGAKFAYTRLQAQFSTPAQAEAKALIRTIYSNAAADSKILSQQRSQMSLIKSTASTVISISNSFMPVPKTLEDYQAQQIVKVSAQYGIETLILMWRLSQLKPVHSIRQAVKRRKSELAALRAIINSTPAQVQPDIEVLIHPTSPYSHTAFVEDKQLPQNKTKPSPQQPASNNLNESVKPSTVAIDTITGYSSQLSSQYRMYASLIMNADPAKARTLNAICNTELNKARNSKEIILPHPSCDLNVIRAGIKANGLSNGRTI